MVSFDPRSQIAKFFSCGKCGKKLVFDETPCNKTMEGIPIVLGFVCPTHGKQTSKGGFVETWPKEDK